MMVMGLKQIDGLKWEQLEPALKDNWYILEEQDNQAYEADTLVGRYIKEQVADGYAIYLITKEYQDKVEIKYVPEVCPDGYRHSYFYDIDVIRKEHALASLKMRDFWRKKE